MIFSESCHLEMFPHLQRMFKVVVCGITVIQLCIKWLLWQKIFFRQFFQRVKPIIWKDSLSHQQLNVT